nr:signal peptidase II [Streptomonospora sp. PA3]
MSAVAAACLAADYATKEAALAAFAPGESMPVVGELLKFTLVFNTGAAFSMGQGLPWLFFFIAVGVVVYILFLARRLGSTAWTIALGMILGGALGNLVDRAFRPPAPLHGAVVDWIQVPEFPVFNIADSCIVVGGALAVLLAFRGINLDGTREPDKHVKRDKPGDAEEPGEQAGAGPAARPQGADRADAGGGAATGPGSGADSAAPAHEDPVPPKPAPEAPEGSAPRREDGGRSA